MNVYSNNIKTGLVFVASFAVLAMMTGGPSRALAASAAQNPATPAAAVSGTNGAVERIKHLHDQLKITADQETQWNNVAQVMQANAAELGQAIKDRIQKAASLNAVDDIRSYQAVAGVHADGLKKLADAFAPLYAAMPEAQQKNADTVFAHKTEPAKLKSHG
jgi:hypothetical protein